MSTRFLLLVLAVLAATWWMRESPERGRVHSVPTAELQTARTTWGRLETLQDHFVRHGSDFGALSAEDYAVKAWQFRERAVAKGLPMKWDGETLRAFEPATQTFAAYRSDGKTKTFFKPNNAHYWAKQPGSRVLIPPWRQR